MARLVSSTTYRAQLEGHDPQQQDRAKRQDRGDELVNLLQAFRNGLGATIGADRGEREERRKVG